MRCNLSGILFVFSGRKKSMKLKTIALAGCFLLSANFGASAHHSFAMFANDKTQTLEGTVKQFEWVNPHSWIHVVAVDDTGKSEEWAFEMGSPGQLASRGWTSASVKVGDKVTVVFHPM